MSVFSLVVFNDSRSVITSSLSIDFSSSILPINVNKGTRGSIVAPLSPLKTKKPY
jgi:hypothetical protein